ncbi:MAG: hypothetical protein ABI383_05300 [Acidobacteriaceae bacterium]
MARSGFWSGFTWGALAGAGAGIGIWAATHCRAAYSSSSGGEGHDRQFSMSSPQPNESVRRDLLETDGTLLESIRGGEQKMDRGRTEADKNEVHSPTNPPGYTQRKKRSR